MDNGPAGIQAEIPRMAGDPEPVEKLPSAELRIGPWRVERSLNQLRRDAETVRLEPKVMDVLVYLAARPGQVIGRESLLEAVWPDVVVGDDALTHAIIKLRKALGDAAHEPAFIETIAKRGYRLIAPVSSGSAPPLAPAEPTPVDVPPRVGRRALTLVSVAVLVVACVGVGVGAALLVDRRSSLPAPETLSGLVPDWSQLAGGPTIVVRPFGVLGDDPQQALLARGLAADLTIDLASMPGLTVLGGPGPVREGGDPSGAPVARYVVSGTVQREAGRLRVNVGLTDATSGQQVWSERFERAAGDLFAIQDDVTARILAVLPVKVGEADRRRAAQRYTRSVEAFELFHRGELAFWAWQPEQNGIAREMYQRAIALDPAFGRAYAALAMTYALDHRFQWVEDPDRALAKAFELAQTARQLGPESPETLFAVAWVHAQRREHAEALRLLQTAVQLNPSYANAYSVMGFSLIHMGRPGEAVAFLRAAMRLAVHPGYHHYVALGKAYFHLGDMVQAHTHLEGALARNPANVEAHLYMAASLARAGKRDDAAWHAAEIRALRPDFKVAKWLETYPLADRAQREQLRTELEKLGL